MPAERAFPPAVQRGLTLLLTATEHVGAAILTLDVVVVFASVVWRYFLHDPVDWAEEVARALMGALVFLGAATAVGRAQHMGVDSLRGLFPLRWRPAVAQLCHWIVAAVAGALLLSACLLLAESSLQTTPIGLPQSIYVWPMVVGSLLMLLFAIAAALSGPWQTVWGTLAGALLVGLVAWSWSAMVPAHSIPARLLLATGFLVSFVIGVPIAFVLAFCALLYFLADPSLPLLVYSQQVLSGTDHFVLLAIPFFVLAGLLMEANGMSSR